MEGGELTIEWRESDGHVLMSGPVEVEFTGRIPALDDVEPEPEPIPVVTVGGAPTAANDVGDLDRFSESPATDPFRRA
jgi:hypothetical protein